VPFAQGREPSEGEQDALLATLLDAAHAAAAYIGAQVDTLRTLTWEHKGPADFVSDVDRRAEAIVRERLLAAHPDAVFVGEESYDPEQSLGHALAFVVDPLDGTTNFLHAFPWYAVSIGATWNGQLVAGVVRNAATGETFGATRGGGAWRIADDGTREPIAVSTITEPARALVGTGFRSSSSSTSRASCGSSRPSPGPPRECAAPAPRRSICATSRAAASTRSGSSPSRRGTSPPASCWCARPAAS
jgi:fructose-1,6-bisphosphatase/inositol monophosphatase family enzyme